MSAATPGLDAARAADPARYAIGSAVPRAAVRPLDRDELCAALRAATRDGLAVVPWGGGTSLGGEAAPARYDLALDVTALDRIVDYDPEDMTATAECGITLAAFGRALADRGQELPIEGGHAARATFGGALSANASGARRLGFGAPRDRILGARFALGDGTLVRTGGRVVKNVAGFAIHRLLCGARGSFAVLVEASLKVAPAPERRVAFAYAADEAFLDDAARWAAIAAVEPAVLTVLGGGATAIAGPPFDGARHVVVVGLEDDAPWVERQTGVVTSVLGAPASRLDGDDVGALWQRMADAAEAPADASIVLTTAERRPAAIGPVLAEPVDRVFHAAAGRLHLNGPRESVTRAAAALAGRGFTPIAARGAEGVVAPGAPAIVALRARIREALDPGGRFALGDG